MPIPDLIERAIERAIERTIELTRPPQQAWEALTSAEGLTISMPRPDAAEAQRMSLDLNRKVDILP